ncbi:DUF3040 domain-containing protein [Lentzea sp. NPDC006480]|uniref:DUF3040 domain-containing protein n=1 Tax=Lentzea sp. NPDC006480 TaxID=3157176 RepID=UPI0033B40DD5
MLSREEQQRLLEIERRFAAAEPDLARALSDGPRGRRHWLLPALVGALLVGLAVVLL